jgi:gluconokinase
VGGGVTGPHHVVVMGVAGAGKTAVADPLSERLGWEFAEGDDFHPAANVEKMRTGAPLSDADRRPWLEALRDWTADRHREGRDTVLTCSALKRAYRDLLREADPTTYFVHLNGDPDLLLDRMRRRQHFMPESLLQSQFDTLEMLEPDESGVLIDVAPPVEEVLARVIAEIRGQFLEGEDDS